MNNNIQYTHICTELWDNGANKSMTGSPTGEHILGSSMFRGVLEIVEEDVCFAGEHVVYVHCRRGRAYCVFRAPEKYL